jgi:hypothetical protein
MAASDVFNGAPTEIEGHTVRVILDAYSPAVIVTGPGAAIAAIDTGLRDQPPRQKRLQASAPDVQTSDDGDVRVANGIYRMLLSARRGGLMTSLRLAGESRADLLRDADVCEGRRKVWGDGPPARLSDAASRPPDVVREGERTRVTFRGIIRKGPPEQEVACADYELEYRCDASPRIGVRLRVRPTVGVGGMNGELLNTLTLGEMTNWFVQTVEGPLHDDFVVRTTGQRIPSGMYWHPVGDRLWESRLQPLDPAVPIVGAYHSDIHEFIAIANPRCSLPDSPENVYLTDVTETGQRLRLVLGIFDRRGAIPAEADAGFEWSYDVIVGRGGHPEALQAVGRLGPPEDAPQLSACGSAYTVENAHYRAVLAKSGGGTIRQLTLKSAGDAVVLRGSDIYTDNGIYPRETKEEGFLGLAAARGDFEPDVSIRREGARLILSFSSLLRNSYRRWAHYATPSIEYREAYEFDASPDIKATVSVRPLLALADTPAFLAWVGQCADTTRWFANAKGGWREGPTNADVGRAWEAKREGLNADDRVIGVANGDRNWFVALTDMRADSPMENAAFNHVSGEGRVGIFLAWHDFEKAPIVPEWKTLTFTIRPGRGDPKSVLRGR